MNCKQANESISIREILESFSLLPSKENPRTAFYHAIERQERTPSLLVNYAKNAAFDFGTGKMYDNVSLVQAIKRCSVAEALDYLSQFDFCFKKQDVLESSDAEKKNKILEVKEVQHPALLDYLNERRLLPMKSELKEIHYEANGRKYFGLGFKNDSGGYEIRSRFSKICIGKKDISTIKNGCETLRIFEGFTDYLSFKILEKNLEKEPSDYLVLNSVSMILKSKSVLKMYTSVELYLDNDEAGNLATERLNTHHPKMLDCRILYKDLKDLNEYLIGKSHS